MIASLSFVLPESTKLQKRELCNQLITRQLDQKIKFALVRQCCFEKEHAIFCAPVVELVASRELAARLTSKLFFMFLCNPILQLQPSFSWSLSKDNLQTMCQIQ